jgi:rod shape-determining protein MreB
MHETQVAGRDLLTGLLRRIPLGSAEIRSVLSRAAAPIVAAVKDTLEVTPPELAADIGDRGLVLVGGGALLRGMDELLARETDLPVRVAEAPLTCVALGAGHSLEEIATLERSRRGARRRR